MRNVGTAGAQEGSGWLDRLAGDACESRSAALQAGGRSGPRLSAPTQ